MKKLALILTGMCFYTFVFAKVYTVSSNPSTLGQFSTIQAAVDVSADGDSIYVYGSPNVYPQFVIIDKKLTVIGPGWAPDKNLPLQAIVAGASLRNTSTAGSPSGSELHGLVFISNVNLSDASGGGSLSVDNLRIIRCQFNQTVTFVFSSSDYLFEGCMFLTTLSFNGSLTYTNFLFQNNLFFSNTCCTSSGISSLTNAINIRFDHNLFYSDNTGAVLFANNCRFLTLTNNIFNNKNAGNDLSFSTFNNNITFLSTQDTPWSVNNNIDGGGNVAGQNPQMADQTAVNAGNFSGLLDFTISTGPANNSGSDGKDMGLLFDGTGSLNWNNSRNGRLPRIYSMNITTPTIPQGGSLTVKVEARRSN